MDGSSHKIETESVSSLRRNPSHPRLACMLEVVGMGLGRHASQLIHVMMPNRVANKTFYELEKGLRAEYIIAARWHVTVQLKHDHTPNLACECVVQCDRVCLRMGLGIANAAVV